MSDNLSRHRISSPPKDNRPSPHQKAMFIIRLMEMTRGKAAALRAAQPSSTCLVAPSPPKRGSSLELTMANIGARLSALISEQQFFLLCWRFGCAGGQHDIGRWKHDLFGTLAMNC